MSQIETEIAKKPACKKFDSLQNLFAENKHLTVFELFMVELLRELFRQLRSESPLILVQKNLDHDHKFQARWRKRTGLFLYIVKLLQIEGC